MVSSTTDTIMIRDVPENDRRLILNTPETIKSIESQMLVRNYKGFLNELTGGMISSREVQAAAV